MGCFNSKPKYNDGTPRRNARPYKSTSTKHVRFAENLVTEIEPVRLDYNSSSQRRRGTGSARRRRRMSSSEDDYVAVTQHFMEDGRPCIPYLSYAAY